ncbi:MAG: hypothetical protein ACYC2U_00055 [Candidatus Amoebophilus sp.]
MIQKSLRILLVGILLILNSCDACKNNSKANLLPGNSYFQIELKPESTSLFTDQFIRIKLNISSKEKDIQGKCYKIRDLKITKGELLYANPNGSYPSEPRRVMAGNNFYPRTDDTSQLIFKPNGQTGQAQIELTLADLEGNQNTTSLNLEVKHSFKIELNPHFDRISTSQAKPVGLRILSNDKEIITEEIYTVTKVEAAYGELQFLNGEVIKLGSKLKYGYQELVFKAQEELDESILNRGSYLSGTYFPGKANGMIQLTMKDEKGKEHSAKVDFKIMPIIFYVEVANIRWNKYEPDITRPEGGFNFSFVGESANQLLDAGFAEIVLKIKDTKDAESSVSSCNELRSEFGDQAWKLVSWKSSDGSPVTIADLGGDQLAEFPLNAETNNYLYFKLNNIKLGIPATLTLQIEGPCHTLQEVIVELPPGHKAMMLGKNINQFLKDTRTLNEKIVNNLKLELASYSYEVRNAKSLSEQAEKQLTYFEQSWKQVKDFSELARLLSASSMEDLKEIYIEIQMLKDNKYELDIYYGF